MTNIIRPDFSGRTKETESPRPANAVDEFRPLHAYGTAAGYLVALVEDASGPEGRVLKVVVGLATGNTIEAVAVMPATDEGRADADTAAMAVLRALEIVEVVRVETQSAPESNDGG